LIERGVNILQERNLTALPVLRGAIYQVDLAAALGAAIEVDLLLASNAVAEAAPIIIAL
jgi:hypothetical protein